MRIAELNAEAIKKADVDAALEQFREIVGYLGKLQHHKCSQSNHARYSTQND